MGATEHERAAPYHTFADWRLSAATGIGWFDADPIIDGGMDTLFAAKVFLCCLHGDVSEQKLNLLQFSPGLRIPLKAISHSGGKPITVPVGNRSGVGAKRRWHFDVAKTDRNRQVESVRSAAKEETRKQRKGCGERGGSPCPRLSTQRPGAR